MDRFGRSKWIFWTFALAVATLAAIPSAILMRAAQDYYRFLTGSKSAAIRPSRVDFPGRRGNNAEPAPDDSLHLVEFRIAAAKARSVELIGDFNDWKAGKLPLSRAGGGYWEIMLPLPAGRYRYLFLVNGQAFTDPRGRSELGTDGRKTSVRTVP
ncbi:MAG TPA: hypothetical protein DEB40_02115 [Elusimicrobia bacterium]|nr:hypothetical protein [Elusimicrobiota bacterium]HBT60526.1 hypothetical protein [Elusimicrobiota bacterium]